MSPTATHWTRSSLALLAVAAATPGVAHAAPAARPNLLLVIADDLGVDKVGSYAADADPTYGRTAEFLPETPVMDLLAESGVRFTDAWANPACSPTRASLYTGRLPLRHGVGQAIGRGGTEDLSTDEITLARVLGDAGYATGLFGKWHLGEGDTPEAWSAGETWEDYLGQTVTATLPPVDLGWDKFQGTKADLDVGSWGGYYDWMELVSVQRWGGWASSQASSDYATMATTQDALDWIDRQTGSWFATVAYHAPHRPLELPPEGCGYDASGVPPTSDKGIYAAMVECLDEQLGVLLDGVSGLENTVVVVLGDNGTEHQLAEGFFDDGQGKGSLYETGVRVPLIVADGYDYLSALGVEDLSATGAWYSRVTNPGRAIASPVHVLDLFATLGTIGGADVSSGIDATSLIPLLGNVGSFERGPVVSEIFSTAYGTIALRSGDLKLVVRANRGPGACRTRYELFDLGDDRQEIDDISKRSAAVTAALVSKLDELVATAPGSWIDVPECDES